MPRPLTLYLVTGNEDWYYDEYDSYIVAEKTPAAAKKHHPDDRYLWNQGKKVWERALPNGNVLVQTKFGSWPVTPDKAKATAIGTAKPGTKPGVILASFNAG